MEDIDFYKEKFGKEAPYFVPDGFFDKMQDEVLAKAAERRHKTHLVKKMVITVLATAAIVSGVIFVPVHKSSFGFGDSKSAMVKNQTVVVKGQTDNKWIEDLSDDDLETMVSLTDNDEFLK